MDRADFSPEAPGILTEIPKAPNIPPGTFAFVPNPLPPEVNLDDETWSLISDASSALGELRGVTEQLPNAELMVRPLIQREAVITSRIEGTVATAQEIALLDTDPSGQGDRNVQEVLNYVHAVRLGIDRLSRQPFDQLLIKRLHQQLMHDVRGQDARAGDYRTAPNFIRGAGGASISEARFVPPPVMQMLAAMDDFEAYIRNPGRFHALVDLALIHYQFEAVHPFEDGNGRIGRLLITLLLIHRNILSHPWLHLSGYFEQNRDQYYDGLLRVSQTGDWNTWIRYFVRAIADQSRDAVGRSRGLLALRNELRQRVQTPRSSALLPQIIDRLFGNPATTIPRVQRQLGITYRGAQQLVQRLVKEEILVESEKRRSVKVFYSPQILEIIDRPRV